jgi:hypothetical protein
VKLADILVSLPILGNLLTLMLCVGSAILILRWERLRSFGFGVELFGFPTLNGFSVCSGKGWIDWLKFEIIWVES